VELRDDYPARTAGRPQRQGVSHVEEAAAYEKHLLEINNKDSRASDKTADVSSAYNDFWWDRGTKIVGTRRTSIITDPENGKLPPLTAEGQQRAAARAAARAARGPADGPEDRNLAERCLVSLNAGPPIVPSAYNNNIQLFQTRGNIGIFNEMIHNNRIIPLDNRPALDSSVHQWMGDSRGRWEGDTLVIETKFPERERVSRRQRSPGSGRALYQGRT